MTAVALLKLKPRIPIINGLEAGVLATGCLRTDPVVSTEGALTCFTFDVLLGTVELSPARTACSGKSLEALGLFVCLTSCCGILSREVGEPKMSAT